MTSAVPDTLTSLRLLTPFGERQFRHRGTPADLAVVQQCFVQPQYDCPGVQGACFDRQYQAILARGQVPFILDLGANIGASAVWFAVRFPAARIVAFEPHPDNFRLLCLNCEGLNVEPQRAAVCGTPGPGVLVDPGIGEWGYRLADSQTPPASGITVDTVVLGEHIAERLVPPLEAFILKVDIEGGEQHLFDQHQSLIDRFPMIILEPHDWLMPGTAVSRGFFRFHATFEREFMFHAENIFSFASAVIRALT